METSPTADQVRATVTEYLARVAGGDAAGIAALYTENGSLRDPAGSEPKVGRAAITEFYAVLAGANVSTELIALRISGPNAAFHFRVTTDTGDQKFIVDPIDVMTFDEQGQITSMAAHWSPTDVVIK